VRIPRIGATAALAISLLVPATAMAVDYPPPSNPGGPSKRPKNTKTLKVCKHGKGCIKTVQKAVNRAKAGDTIKIGHGTYREGVSVSGRKKAYLRLIGDAKHPGKVVIDARKKKQNSIFINGANNVTVSGITTRNYVANGVFALNVDGYDFNHLIAHNGGSYGIYAFNSKGGRITDSTAYYNNDGGFYIGQTPKQTKPKRSVAKNLVAWGNAIGWSGTNMRYVTITKSQFFNNGVGMAPNALDSEKFPPAEDNVIADNDIFWNNFNYFAGAPFKPKKFGGGFALPPGMGILMIGVRTTKIQNNRIYGNYLVGIAEVTDFALSKPENQQFADPVSNEVSGNQFGLGGQDLNGRDIAYDGSGRLNCFQSNELHSPTIPADGNTFAACPGPDPNHADPSVLQEGAAWLTDDTHEKYWIKNPHAPKAGYNPLEHWTSSFDPGSSVKAARRAAKAVVSAARSKTVKVGDYFLSPGKLTVSHGTKVTWKWLASNGDTHDVKLKKGPKGVKKFHSGYASTDYTYAKKLRKPGKYTVICTLHPNSMHQTITVK
jgi:plastocyanin